MDVSSKKRKVADAAAFLVIMLVATSGMYLFEHMRIEDEKDALEDEQTQRMVDDTSRALFSTTIDSVEYTGEDGSSRTIRSATVQDLVAEDLSLRLFSQEELNTSRLGGLEGAILDIMEGLTPDDMALELHAGIGSKEYITLSKDNPEMIGPREHIGSWSKDMTIPSQSRTGTITLEFYSIP